MRSKKPIDSLILTLRGEKVILASDLAELYGVETKALNQAVKRNAGRFPEDFAFQLTSEEAVEWQRSRSQNVTLKRGANLKYRPWAFTEHGAIMAATVLNSPEAVSMSVFVVRAFVQMREQLSPFCRGTRRRRLRRRCRTLSRQAVAANTAILKRLAEIDKTLLNHDDALRTIWTRLQPLLQPPPEPLKPRIGFHKRDA